MREEVPVVQGKDEHTPDVESHFRLVLRSAPLLFLSGLMLAFLLASVLSHSNESVWSKSNPTLIFYPAFAMFLLAALVLTLMGWNRIGAVRSGEMDLNFYRTFSEGEESESLRVITRNFINLFEMPVLFYVGIILAHLAHQVSYWMVGVAWAYVALRYLHTYVHLTSNTVAVRLSVYMASGLLLLVLWGTLFVQLLTETPT